MSSPVEVVARTLMVELGFDPELPMPAEYVKLAQAVLFDLGKANIRLVESGDVLVEELDRDAGTVHLMLRLDE